MSITMNFAELVFVLFLNIVSFQRNINEFTTKQSLYLALGPINLMKIIYMLAVCDKITKRIKKTGFILVQMWSDATDVTEKIEVSNQNWPISGQRRSGSA